MSESVTSKILKFPYSPDTTIQNPRLVAGEAEPLLGMYESLIPDAKTVFATGWIPPRMHCGWPVDREGVFKWCKERDCLALVETWVTPEDDSDSGVEFDSSEETTVMVPDLYYSFHRGKKLLLAEAGVSNIELTLRVPHATIERFHLLITYMTNADCIKGRHPPIPDIKKVKAKLLEAGWIREEHKQALWYLDWEKWAWKPLAWR